MRIGRYQVHSLLTSYFSLDGGSMFGSIPKTLWEKKIPSDEKNRIPLCTRSLFLVDDDRRIIVDTGNGDKWDDKYRAIYNIDTQSVNLESSLNSLGYKVDDITDIICSHLHFDHAGGNTKIDDQGKVVPTFPYATYWIQKTNLELANHPSEKDRASYLSHNWEVLAENGMIECIDGTESFLSDIEIFVSNGHTTGQQHLILRDEKTALFFAGDLFPTMAHIPIPWVMAYDLRPLQTIREKKSLLQKIVEEDWLVFFEHDRECEAAKVEFDGKSIKIGQKIKI